MLFPKVWARDTKKVMRAIRGDLQPHKLNPSLVPLIILRASDTCVLAPILVQATSLRSFVGWIWWVCSSCRTVSLASEPARPAAAAAAAVPVQHSFASKSGYVPPTPGRGTIARQLQSALKKKTHYRSPPLLCS
eukprot:2352835-Amphidinium_carterae.1